MTASKQKVAAPKKVKSIMASVVFPPELYRTLKEIAKREKVSFAWVVRRAAEKYAAAVRKDLKQKAARMSASSRWTRHEPVNRSLYAFILPALAVAAARASLSLRPAFAR